MFLQNHEKTALKWRNKEVSYANLLKEAIQYSKLLPDTTKRVLIFSENRPEWIYSFYGSWKNNCTVIPVDYLSTVEEVSYIVKDCAPDVFFCSRERKPILKEVARSLDYTPQILVYEDIEDVNNLTDSNYAAEAFDQVRVIPRLSFIPQALPAIPRV